MYSNRFSSQSFTLANSPVYFFAMVLTVDFSSPNNTNKNNSIEVKVPSTENADAIKDDITGGTTIMHEQCNYAKPSPQDAKDFVERWSRPNLMMQLIVFVIFPGLVTYLLYFTLNNFYVSMVYMIISYWFEALFFLAGHLFFHLWFIKLRDGVYHYASFYVEMSYLHHYVDPTIFYKVDFASHLLGYWFTMSFPVGNAVMSKQAFEKSTNSSFRMRPVLEVPATKKEIFAASLLLLCASAISYAGVCRCAFVVLYLVAGYFGSSKLQIMTILLQVNDLLPGSDHTVYVLVHFPVMSALNDCLHIWYHTPLQKRRDYWSISYPFWNTLEQMNIISTKHHKKHHEHRLDEMEEVTVFSDLPLFVFEEFVENLCNRAFKLACTNSSNDGRKSFYSVSKCVCNRLLQVFAIGVAPMLLLHFIL